LSRDYRLTQFGAKDGQLNILDLHRYAMLEACLSRITGRK
jgi:hypothetical protein